MKAVASHRDVFGNVEVMMDNGLDKEVAMYLVHALLGQLSKNRNEQDNDVKIAVLKIAALI